MSVFPILLDASPQYLRRSSRAGSLLLTPIASGPLICRLHASFGAVSVSKLMVMPSFRPDATYRQTLHRACDQVARVLSRDELHEMVSTLEPSDWLLFVDAQCATEHPIDPTLLQQAAVDTPRSAVHLVALESNAGGTCEWVDVNDRGDVSRIQRFYDDLTWSYTAGVAASLVPVPYLLTDRALRFDSLRHLRAALASRGVPARDIAIDGDAFDLSDEREFLALTDRVIRAYAAGRNGAAGYIAANAIVHASARMLGPIIVHDGARIGEDATVVGPTVIGAGATIGAGAVVVQCVVDEGVELEAGAVVRQQLVREAVADENAEVIREIANGYEPARIRAFRSQPDTPAAPRRVYPSIKRVVESTLATAALVVLLPLFAVIALLIKLESNGPVFFADRREAKGGRTFPCFKFRTMVHGAAMMQRDLQAKNEVDGPQFKLEKDPRLTRVGRWIRPCSIDELPQLVNVALGHMSLVGPRPSPFRENQTCVPWREGRLSVRPGITGLWQVCRHDRAEGDFHQWIHYDLLYVEHMSAVVDLKIAIATLVTLGGKWCVPLTWIIPRRKLPRAA